MIIRNANIFDAVHPEPYIGDIAVRGGVISETGGRIEAAPDEEIVNAAGLRAYPGLIDAHSHVGLDPYGAGFSEKDYNETTEPLTPQLRGIDSFNPMDEAVRQALEAGVTTIATGPGSSNVLGGTFFAVKTCGNCVDDMVLRNPIAMKAAFGENPKRVFFKKGVSVRMTVAAKLRDMLFQTQEYIARKDAAGDDVLRRPKFDMKLEALEPVVRGELPLKAHAHRADDICTAIRIAKEFNLKLTIEHCTEGHLIVDQLVKAGCPVAVGPSMMHATKIELRNKTFETPGILAKAGLSVSIITDAPATPQPYLGVCAGLAVKAGMEPFSALQAITINPAKHIGVADRVGSLEVGKDADIVLPDGDIMESTTCVKAVIVNGKTVIAR